MISLLRGLDGVRITARRVSFVGLLLQRGNSVVCGLFNTADEQESAMGQHNLFDVSFSSPMLY